MSDFRKIIEQALIAEGAIVERIQSDGIEVLAPPHVQQALGLAEWSRLGFGVDLPEHATRVHLDLDWCERLEKMLGQRGRLLHISMPHDLLSGRRQDLGMALQRDLSLGNATFRVSGTGEALTCYLLLVYRITAVSDEKREDHLHLCINETNGFPSDPLAAPLLSRLDELRPAEHGRSGFPAGFAAEQIVRAVGPMLASRIRSRLAPFTAGMERRLARDLDRLLLYHQNLRSEAARRLADKMRKGDAEDSLRREQMRIEAVEREYGAKIADLQRKYHMSVEVRLVQSLRVMMPVVRAEILLLRRKGRRDLLLDWNPISRSFDPVPCEACWVSGGSRLQCDERLHLTCAACMPLCPSCGKPTCRACEAKKCARCGASLKES